MKKIAKRLAILIGIHWLACTSSLPAQDLSRWMGQIPPARSIAELAIPGTHDSGALYENFRGATKCQNLSITDQLNIGVRFLDVRCRHVHDGFLIYHGSVYQRLSFEEVLKSCESFLGQNPRECVIMSIQEEYKPKSDTRLFDQTVQAYLAEDPKRWWLEDRIPTLGQAAGKIVLFRRFPTSSTLLGLTAQPWPDNTNFSNSGPSFRFAVQDRYELPHPREKITAIEQAYQAAAKSDPNCLYVNFTSGYKPLWFLGIPRIMAVENVVKPWLIAYLQNPAHPRNGITVLNFADETECRLLIRANK
jgi:1-phosphatidylinositol phosphodiesterase